MEKLVASGAVWWKKTWYGKAFRALDSELRGHLYKHELLQPVTLNGVETHDLMKEFVKALEEKKPTDVIEFEEFTRLVAGNKFLKRVFESQLVIPEWTSFEAEFKNAFNEIKQDPKYDAGQNADYIETLKNANPRSFASAFCSIDGQFVQLGDFDGKFSIQSISKVVAYSYLHSLYVEKGKEDEFHQYVGEEPSGKEFNKPVFDKRNRPHNPMVNAGAIMVSTLLVNEGKTINDLVDFFTRASGVAAAIDVPLYEEESMTGYTNHALRSLMLGRKCYPQKETKAA